MSQNQFIPRKPDFKDSNGVLSVWVNQDKNTKQPYLSIKLFGSATIIAKKPEPPKPKEPIGADMLIHFEEPVE